MAPSQEYPRVYLYRRLVQAKQYIDTRFACNPDLGNIAGEATFSKFHFIRLFRKSFGFTPHQYLTRVRLTKAKQLLREGNPVTEVCEAVGFESPGSFAGLFKRTTGMSPSAWQDRQLLLEQKRTSAPLDFIPHCFANANGWTPKKSNFEEVR